MKIGKLSAYDLQNIILNKLAKKREDILIYPGVGEDCGAISFGEFACVTSTDPITAAEDQIGRLAVHINCNDIASSGAKPVAILTTILLPPSSSEEDLKKITTQINDTADELGVAVIGGHTEITDAVNKPVVTATAIGRIETQNLITTSGAKPDDMLVMTKLVGLEGTAILAYEFEDKLKEILSDEELQYAKSMMEHISVVKEGVIAGEFGVHAMHDVTEGGLLGGLWELCYGQGVGCEIDYAAIPIADVSKRIADILGISVLRLMSSGTMLIIADQTAIEGMRAALNKENIALSVIGKIIEGDQRLIKSKDTYCEIAPPKGDALYDVHITHKVREV